jgi:hypothetical protein
MKRFVPILAIALLLTLAATSFACPMCKDSITDTANAAKQEYGSGGPEAGLPGGFNFSVYYMLIGLFCTIGLVAGIITKGIRSTNVSDTRGFEPLPAKM